MQANNGHGRGVGRGVGGRVACGVACVGPRVGVAVATPVAVGCGVGVAGALSVTISDGDSCGLPKLSNARTRNRYRPGCRPAVFHTPKRALSTPCAR